MTVNGSMGSNMQPWWPPWIVGEWETGLKWSSCSSPWLNNTVVRGDPFSNDIGWSDWLVIDILISIVWCVDDDLIVKISSIELLSVDDILTFNWRLMCRHDGIVTVSCAGMSNEYGALMWKEDGVDGIGLSVALGVKLKCGHFMWVLWKFVESLLILLKYLPVTLMIHYSDARCLTTPYFANPLFMTSVLFCITARHILNILNLTT